MATEINSGGITDEPTIQELQLRLDELSIAASETAQILNEWLECRAFKLDRETQYNLIHRIRQLSTYAIPEGEPATDSGPYILRLQRMVSTLVTTLGLSISDYPYDSDHKDKIKDLIIRANQLIGVPRDIEGMTEMLGLNDYKTRGLGGKYE